MIMKSASLNHKNVEVLKEEIVFPFMFEKVHFAFLSMKKTDDYMSTCYRWKFFMLCENMFNKNCYTCYDVLMEEDTILEVREVAIFDSE